MFAILLYIVSFLLVFLLVMLIALMVYSPGKPQPFRDQQGNRIPGSVSEKLFLTIGGVKQGMFIRGKDTANPVLLYVHGGPAFPNYFLIDRYEPGLEEYFTVCYWEQRGGGLSYSSEVRPESMNLEQFTNDLLELSNYLRERFGQEKIFLMAHSGGTSFAIQAAAKAPELFHAYIGMAQITCQPESEKIAYAYMLEQFRKSGDERSVEAMKKYPVLDSDTAILPFYRSLVRDKSMHALGIGTMREMRSVFRGVFLPVWMCKAYTLREKIRIWKSKFSFLPQTSLYEQLFALDIPAQFPALRIPVYFFSGRYDLTVNYGLSKAYLEQLDAPLKGFYTFGQSAHSPIYEEQDRFREIMRNDVRKLRVSMADSEQRSKK